MAENKSSQTYISVAFGQGAAEHNLSEVFEDVKRVADGDIETVQLQIAVPSEYREQLADVVQDTEIGREYEVRLWDEKKGEDSTEKPDPL